MHIPCRVVSPQEHHRITTGSTQEHHKSTTAAPQGPHPDAHTRVWQVPVVVEELTKETKRSALGSIPVNKCNGDAKVDGGKGEGGKAEKRKLLNPSKAMNNLMSTP